MANDQDNKKAKYGPTELAKASPRRLRIDKKSDWIGVGGPITVKAKPPVIPVDVTYREANASEYEKLKHLTHLVKAL